MNATQVKHLVKRLNEKLDAKFPQERYSRYSDPSNINNLSPEDFFIGIVSGTIVLRPKNDREEDFGTYSLCYAKDFEKIKAAADKRAKVREFRENALKDIRDIEDRLVFTGAHNAQSILDSFEATLNRLAK